jgi:hypothetical protein
MFVPRRPVGVAQTFQSKEALLLYVDKQREQAKEVVVVYEAGPLGYTLYRELKAKGKWRELLEGSNRGLKKKAVRARAHPWAFKARW